MNLYNNYCYPDIDTAARAEITAAAVLTDTGIMTGKLYTVTGPESVDMAYHYSPLTGAAYDVVHARVYPSCTQVGYLTNYSGLTLADVTEVSFGVVLVWAIAFSFRSMGRSMGGR